MDDTTVLRLFEIVTGALERNTSALEKIESVIGKDAEATEKMSTEVRGLRRIIGGAQNKIGGEIGKVIDDQKERSRKILEEIDSQRGAPDRRPVTPGPGKEAVDV